MSNSPLHIAVVTETFPPEVNGVAMTIGRMVDGLLTQGHRVSLARPRQKPEQPGNHPALLLPGLPIPNYPELRMGLPVTGRLLRAWRADRPDLVQVVTEGPLGWSALQAARKLGIPAISEFHTNFDTYTRHYHLGWLERSVAAYLSRFHNQAACTLVPTETMADKLRELGLSRLRVVARGVDTTLFRPERRDPALRQSWGAGADDLVAITVGRLAPEKNIDEVFLAFAALRQQAPTARLVLVGDGPHRARLQKAYPDTLFAGMRRSEELARHYASADVFLFPSLSETYGNVTMEALASGLAVVAYDYAAAHQYIHDNNNGLLAPFGDRSRWIAAAARLADAELRGRLGRAAVATAQAASWEQIFRTLQEVFFDIVQQGTQHGPSPSQPEPAH